MIGSEGSLFLDDPWHCNEPVIELRRERRRRADRARARGLLPARAREPERRDPRRGRAAARPRGRASARRARSRRCTSPPRRARSSSSRRRGLRSRSRAARAARRPRPAGRSRRRRRPASSPSNAATPPRKNVKNGSKLARSTGIVLHLLGELARRARVAAGGGVRLPLGVQARIGRRAVHRGCRHELAVGVGDEDRDGAGASETTKSTIARACSSFMQRFCPTRQRRGSALRWAGDERACRTGPCGPHAHDSRHAVPGPAAEAERPTAAPRSGDHDAAGARPDGVPVPASRSPRS